MWNPIATWWRRRHCPHGSVGEQLVDFGRAKMVWCRACGKTWFR